MKFVSSVSRSQGHDDLPKDNHDRKQWTWKTCFPLHGVMTDSSADHLSDIDDRQMQQSLCSTFAPDIRSNEKRL